MKAMEMRRPRMVTMETLTAMMGLRKPKTRGSEMVEEEGKGDGGKEMEIDEGEEHKGEVGDGDHVGCRDDDEDGKGVELLKGEVVTRGIGGGAGEVGVLHLFLLYMNAGRK